MVVHVSPICNMRHNSHSGIPNPYFLLVRNFFVSGNYHMNIFVCAEHSLRSACANNASEAMGIELGIECRTRCVKRPVVHFATAHSDTLSALIDSRFHGIDQFNVELVIVRQFVENDMPHTTYLNPKLIKNGQRDCIPMRNWDTSDRSDISRYKAKSDDYRDRSTFALSIRLN